MEIWDPGPMQDPSPGAPCQLPDAGPREADCRSTTLAIDSAVDYGGNQKWKSFLCDMTSSMK